MSAMKLNLWMNVGNIVRNLFKGKTGHMTLHHFNNGLEPCTYRHAFLTSTDCGLCHLLV